MTFERLGLKVILKKTKVMMSGLKGEIIESKVDTCTKCGDGVMANSMLLQNVGYLVDARR